MFAPPGTKIFASRILSRKQNKMQQTAMKEALAAGWQQYNSDDESSDDDDADNNSAVQDLLGIDDTETTELSHSNNDTHLYTASSFPNQVSVGGEENDDDDDSSVESDEDSTDGTALANEELHKFLDALHQQSTPAPVSSTGVHRLTGEVKVERDDAGEGYFDRHVEPDQSEIKIDADQSGTRFATVSSPYSSIDSSDEGEDAISDADSLDLGVPTTVWPSKNEHPFSNDAITNDSAKRAIADIVSITNVFSPTSEKHMMSPTYHDDDQNHADPNYSEDDEDDEPHEGSEVFLFTEGTRYSGKGNGRAGIGNKLIHIQEAASISFVSSETKNDDDEGFDAKHNENNTKNLRLVIKCDDDSKPQGGDNCFGSIQLVSPKFFHSDEKPSVIKEEQPKPVMSPLSSMVHPMNLALFDSNDIDRSIQRREEKKMAESNKNASPNRVDRVPTSILTSIEQDYALTDSDNRRSNLATSFKSSTKTNRIAYHISDGRKSMTKTERVYSKSFLPKEQIQNPQSSYFKSSSSTRSSSKTVNRSSLAILLADVKSKIFEVVAIDIQQDTSVGDVLSKARTSATDPALSEQKYVSFCYGTQEFGAPMLPVNLVIDWEKHKTRPLVVAVPVGSTASEMQSVKRVLWKNPKLRDWWKQDDPFVPKFKKDVVPLESIIATPPPVPLEPTKSSPTLMPMIDTKVNTVALPVVAPVIPSSPTMVSTLKTYERVEV
jgi:hypothetical protein